MSEHIIIENPKTRRLVPPTPTGKPYKADVCAITKDGLTVGTLERGVGDEGGIAYNTSHYTVGYFDTDQEARDSLIWDYGGLINKNKPFYFKDNSKTHLQLENVDQTHKMFPTRISPVEDILEENIDEYDITCIAYPISILVSQKGILSFWLRGETSYTEWGLSYYLQQAPTPVNFLFDWENKCVSVNYPEGVTPAPTAMENLQNNIDTKEFQTLEFWTGDNVRYYEPLPIDNHTTWSILEKIYHGITVKLNVWTPYISLSYGSRHSGDDCPMLNKTVSRAFADKVIEHWKGVWEEIF